MEPIQRRSFDRVPARRPLMGGMPNTPGGVRPAQSGAGVGPQPGLRPVQPAAAAQPSALRPPNLSGPAMDVQPAHHQPAAQHAAAPGHSLRPMATPHHTAAPAPSQVQHRPLHPPAPVHAGAPRAAQPQQGASLLTPPALAGAATLPAHHVQPATAPAQPAAAGPHPQHASAAFRMDDETTGKGPKMPHPTGHSGLIGFVTFLVFGALFLTPLLPGKIWEEAPGSSQSASTGNETIGCASELTNTKSSLSYDIKIGFPLNYDYATTSTMTAECNGKPGHAIAGHTSQFNPLGLLADTALAVVIAVITAKLWRRFKSPS